MDLLRLILVLATIVGVTDGETIHVKNDTGQLMTVRLVCIDTHSTTQPMHSLAATQRLKELLPPGSPVVIRNVEKDESGHTVGEVFVNNRSVNLKMVEEGNAVIKRESLDNCYESKTQFFLAEANAKNQHLGFWNISNNSGIEPKIQTLRGKLVYEEIPTVMSLKAYQGDEFFLITNSQPPSRLVVRPSQKISRAELRLFHNQQVKIKAVFVEGTRPSPQGKSPCPLDAHKQCLPQGGGYQVLSIVRFN